MMKTGLVVLALIVVSLSTGHYFSSAHLNLKQLRNEYVLNVGNLKKQEAQLEAEHLAPCAIAEKLSQQRRAIGKAYKEATPGFLRSIIYKRNEKKYHDRLGPTFQYLKEHGASCEQIIVSAQQPSGADMGLNSWEMEVVSDLYAACEAVLLCEELKQPVVSP